MRKLIYIVEDEADIAELLDLIRDGITPGQYNVSVKTSIPITENFKWGKTGYFVPK